jgi:hypothetical protein
MMLDELASRWEPPLEKTDYNSELSGWVTITSLLKKDSSGPPSEQKNWQSLLQPKDIGMEMSKINRKTSEIT